MADSPLAIRTSEEIKMLFNELSEQGDFNNKGDFLQRLLVLYQAETTKKDVDVLKPAIETVETLTTRLLEILNGTAITITTKEEKYKEELEKQKESYEETNRLLQQQISSLKSEHNEDEIRVESFIKDKEMSENKIDELLQRVNQLEGTIDDKTALVEEYKNKNNTLNGIVADHKQSASKNKQLTDTVNSLTQENSNLKIKTKELTKELQKQADAFKMEQENLKKTLIIDKDSEILKLRTEHQRELQEQQELYNSKVKELLDKLESNQTVVTSKPSATNKKKTTTTKKRAEIITEAKKNE